jgi:hypothetical protein
LRKLKLTDEIRTLLKQPLGTLIEGTQDETMEELRKVIEIEKPKIIVAVGDSVSQNMVNHGINANIYIIDYKTMRNPVKYYKLNAAISTRVKNPAGEISEEAWNNIKELIHQTKTAEIIVDGEEDLLTLPAIAQAPINSLVIYGQPEVGIVVVKVTDKKKKEIKEITSKMQAPKRSKKTGEQ